MANFNSFLWCVASLSFLNASETQAVAQPLPPASELPASVEPLISAQFEERIPTNLDSNGMAQITLVSQLADVQPNDWAYQALQSLVERYGCIAGFPDSRFRGQQALTRYEFAAGLNACLDRINELIAAGIANSASDADLLVLQRLQTEFAIELAALGDRVNRLEARTAELEANQFSTTTTLSGEVIIAVNGGGFAGESIVDANGVEVTNSNPNSTLLYRTTLTFNTSFSGTDQLRIVLSTGSNEGGFDNTTGILEPSLGSGLEFSVKPPTSEVIGLSRAFYTFTPFEDVSVSIGPNIRTTDYLDRNSFANQSDRNFSTLAFVNNYLLFPLFGPAAGGEIEWNPGKGPLTLRALYAASDASNPNGSDTAPNQAIAPFVNLLYPPAPGSSPVEPGEPPLVPASERGLFSDTYQGSAEVEFAPSDSFTLRLQYSGGQLFANRYHVIGANFEWAIVPQIALFGRYGYGSFENTVFGDINPNYWMAGVTFPDLFVEGAIAGIAAGQPFIANEIGNDAQTNFEAFYNFPVTDNITVTPLIQVVTNAANQESNSTIVTGTVRSVFSF